MWLQLVPIHCQEQWPFPPSAWVLPSSLSTAYDWSLLGEKSPKNPSVFRVYLSVLWTELGLFALATIIFAFKDCKIMESLSGLSLFFRTSHLY